MKHAYIILSRSKTILARAIQLVTRQKYNHSSLALEKSCATFYSFGRRNPRVMFPAGFIIEGVDKGFFALHPDVPAAIYEVEMGDEEYELLKKRISVFTAKPRHYKYSVRNLFYQRRGIPYHNGDKYVCSAFIATMLEGILETGKDPSLVYPHDFQHLGLPLVYEGPVGEYTAFYLAQKAQEEQEVLV